jgi:PAS domain S-box-containing protein
MSQTLCTLLETVQHRFDCLERTIQIKAQANRGNCATIAEMKTEIQALRSLIEELQDQTQGLITPPQSLEIPCQRDVEAYAKELHQINQQLQQEIHDRKQVEATLRQSEARFRDLTETIQDVFYIADPSAAKAIYISPAYDKLWGQSRERVYQNFFAWTEAIHPEDYDRVRRSVEQQLQFGGEFVQQYRIIRPDGTLCWVLDRNFPVHDETGKLLRIVGVIKDISDRVQMEQERQQVEAALRESEARYRTITELTSDYIYSCAITLEGGMIEEWATPNVVRITGYTFEDFPTGENAWLTAVHPDDLEQVCQFERGIIERNQPGSLEYRIVTQSGETRWICDHIQPQWSEAEQRVVRFLGAVEDITDRKQAEEALRKSEEQLRLTFDLTRIGCWDLNYLTGEEIWNDNHYLMWGYAPGSVNVTPQTWRDRVHPEDIERIEALMTHALNTDTDYEAEYRIVLGDGNSRWVISRGRGIHNEQGEAVRMLGIILDITERKAHDTQLRLLESVVLHTNDAILITAADPVAPPGPSILYVNPAFTKMTGYSAEETIGQTPFMFVGPKTYLETIDQMLAALRLGQADRAELISYRKDGSEFWIELNIIPILNEHGCLTHWVNVQRDITQRKQSETQLRQFNAELELRVQQRTHELQDSEERFRLAFDHAVNGIALISPDGYWLKVNPALCQILGYTEQEFYALTIDQLTHPDDLELRIDTFRKALAGEISISQIENRYLHKLGHPVWTICAAVLVRDRDNVPLYFVAQVQDITERREIDQLKQEFISIVSHELRTPLTSIQGSLGLLTAGVLNDEPDTMNHMLTIAESEAQRLVRLVNDILDLERLEAYNVILNQHWWRVSTVLEHAIAALQSFVEQHPVTISICPDSLEVWADRDRIVQVLVNILSNATKFSPVESTIELSVEHVSTPIPHALFQIRDYGRGIPSHQLEAIFGRFKQVDSSDSRNQGGTGLGLAICRNIVQQHGGRIWVESTLGEGSTFYFTIPRPSE